MKNLKEQVGALVESIDIDSGEAILIFYRTSSGGIGVNAQGEIPDIVSAISLNMLKHIDVCDVVLEACAETVIAMKKRDQPAPPQDLIYN